MKNELFHLGRYIKSMGFIHCRVCLGKGTAILDSKCKECKGTGKLSILQVFYENEIENRIIQANKGEQQWT